MTSGQPDAGRSLRSAVDGAAARLRQQLDDPDATQEALLRASLAVNRDSAFGRAHDFAAIADAAAFRHQVPIRSDDELRPWIERSTRAARGVLTSEPIVAFEETGGSTAGPRLVPYTARGLAEFGRGLHAWLDDLFTAFPGVAGGSFYWSISPACRIPRRLPNGVAIGMASDASYFGAELAPHIAASLAVAADVGACADTAEWRRRTLLDLLAHEDLTLISVWSPSFLADLLAAARQDAASLVEALVGSGRTSAARAARVRAALQRDPIDVAAIWPGLAVVSCWDQAAARGPAESLRRLFAPAIVQGKGLLATECLMTLPLHELAFPVLALESGYFEFRELGGERLRRAATVEDGADYELVLSNGSGLWRYAIGDVVRVRGFAGRTPMLEFLGRAGGSDLCGEKLSEAFVGQVLAKQRLDFAALAADAQRRGYVLVVDAGAVGADAAPRLGAEVERGLHANPQYAHARSLGQLAPLTVERVVDVTPRWTRFRLRTGQRLGDIKLPTLLADAVRAAWLG